MSTYVKNQLKAWSHLDLPTDVDQYVVVKEEDNAFYTIPYFTYEWFTRKRWDEYWDLLNFHVFQDTSYHLCERTTIFLYEGYEWLFDFEIERGDASHARKIGWFFHQFATMTDVSICERLEYLLSCGPVTLPPISILKQMVSFIIEHYDHHKDRLLLLLSPSIQRYTAS